METRTFVSTVDHNRLFPLPLLAELLDGFNSKLVDDPGPEPEGTKYKVVVEAGL